MILMTSILFHRNLIFEAISHVHRRVYVSDARARTVPLTLFLVLSSSFPRVGVKGIVYFAPTEEAIYEQKRCSVVK